MKDFDQLSKCLIFFIVVTSWKDDGTVLRE